MLPPCVIMATSIEDENVQLVRTGLSASATAMFTVEADLDACAYFNEVGFFRVQARASVSSGTYVEEFLPVTFRR